MLATLPFYDDSFTKRQLYTAWDNLKDEGIFTAGIDRLTKAGIAASSIMVYMLVGFDQEETWERIFHRFDVMQALGVVAYPHGLRIVPGSPPSNALGFRVLKHCSAGRPFANFTRSRSIVSARAMRRPMRPIQGSPSPQARSASRQRRRADSADRTSGMSESLSDTFRRLSEAATDVTAHRGKVAGFRDNRSVKNSSPGAGVIAGRSSARCGCWRCWRVKPTCDVVLRRRATANSGSLRCPDFARAS